LALWPASCNFTGHAGQHETHRGCKTPHGADRHRSGVGQRLRERVRAGDATLPEAVAQLRPDVVVVRSDSGVRDVLEHIAVATQHARRPIALFTNSEDRPTMRQALDAGVSAYVVRGANRERVQSVIDVAVERFAAEEALREELASTKTELADRKLIDRAKRLLMSKKGLPEPDAHRFLQDLAMSKGIRLRDAAERVIDLESLLG
jgi:two-component system, response regulator / RNA-binding antiterminator